MPPRKCVPRLDRLCLLAMGRGWIQELILSVANDSFSASGDGEGGGGDTAAHTRVDEIVERLQEHLFGSVPCYCYQNMVDIYLEVLTDIINNSKALYRKACLGSRPEKSVHQVHVAVRFAKLLLHPRIRCLDLSKLPKILRDLLYKHLECFTELQVLNLGSSGSGETAGRKRLFMSLKYLGSLQHLTLNNDCVNETLSVLGQNCLDLQYLDITGSTHVTDLGVSWLLRCRKLTHLNLYQTSVTEIGYAQLLRGLPHLQTVGRCDLFGKILEYISLYSSNPVTLAIQSFHSRDMSFNQLELLVKMCPELRHVNLYVDEDMGNLLKPFEQLEHLEELKLLACNFYSDGIDDLLRARGSNLRLLHLEHVDELDMNALCCIAETCLHLKKLVFFSCDFVENFGDSLVSKTFSTPPFAELNELVCVSESAPNVIEFLLIHGSKLKTVQFGSTAWFNDDTVLSVTNQNALREVEEIKILRSYEITMKSVDLLLVRCPNLRTLAEMDGWEGISELELVRLRNKIRVENYDLDTFISWNMSG